MKKDKTFLIVGAVHGDERVGVEVIKGLGNLLDQKDIKGIVANKKAFGAKVRFIKQDLNRSFPGNPRGNFEEKIAYRLTKILKNFDYVLDLHSFSCQSDPFVIITKKTAQHFRLAKAARIRKVVFMSPALASGKALIDHCRCGISIETGRHNQRSTYRRAINLTNNILSELGFLKKRRREAFKISYFKVVDVFSKKSRDERLEKNVENFRLVHQRKIVSRGKRGRFVAPYNFYPILARERAYSKILCLAARNVKLRGGEKNEK